MIRSQRGVALLTSLAILVVVGGIAALMFTRTLAEIRHSGDDSGIVQSLMLARGAANLAGAIMQGPARTALDGIVQNQANMVSRWAFGTGAGVRPDPLTVVQALSTNTPNVATSLQTQINNAVCPLSVPGLAAGESVTLRIHVTNGPACGIALPSGIEVPTGRFVAGAPRDGSGGAAATQTYAIPFVIVAEGTSGTYTRSIVTSGEYHFILGRGSFAQYALFTNVHRTGTGSSGQPIWFTDNTLFDGPVHTNQHFRFFRNPWFGGMVTSAGCNNPGNGVCTSDSYSQGGFFHNGTTDGSFLGVGSMPDPSAPVVGANAPEFAGGVGWTSPYIPLPANNQDQRAAAQAGGLYFGNSLYMMTVRATTDGGSNGIGNNMPADGSGTAAYQEIRGCRQVSGRLECREYRINASNQVQTRLVTYQSDTVPGGAYQSNAASRVWQTASPATFNGAVFVEGQIDRLTGPTRPTATPDNPATAAPALASFAQMTIASNGLIRITGDLKYQDPPCSGSPTRSGTVVTPATCDNLTADNILGVYSQSGDIRIGHNNSSSGSNVGRNAPRDVTIHGVLMSSAGVVAVDNWGEGGARGTVNLLGGIIENAYGAFGTFNSSTGVMASGYARAFTFDRRTGAGMAPPFFPTVGNDNVIDAVVFSFGQREQLE